MRSCWNEQAMRQTKNTLVMNAVPRVKWLHFSGNSWLCGRSWLTHHWLDLAPESHNAAVGIFSPSSRLSGTKSRWHICRKSWCQNFSQRLCWRQLRSATCFPALSSKEVWTVRRLFVCLFEMQILSESCRHLYCWYSTATHCMKGRMQHFPNGWEPKPSRGGDPHFPEEKQQQQQQTAFLHLHTHRVCKPVKGDRGPGVTGCLQLKPLWHATAEVSSAF